MTCTPDRHVHKPGTAGCECGHIPATTDEPSEAEVLRAARERIGVLEAELEAARMALAEVHEYQCGCDVPGSLSRCVAQPVVVFELLREAE